MKYISVFICILCLVCFTIIKLQALARADSVLYASLIDNSQNLNFESKPSLSSRFLKLAKVHFIINDSDKIGFDNIDQNFDHDNAERCKNLGFNKTENCKVNEYVSRRCPYDETYYDTCCDKNFAYFKAECSYPNTISGNSCGGKFKCYCDRALYPYTATSCPSPKIHNQDKCSDLTYVNDAPITEVYYSDCVCPADWIICDSSIHQKGNGSACTYNGITTYASCSCESGYDLTCEEFGPAAPQDYCFIGGTKYYKNCNDLRKYCTNKGYEYGADNPCPENYVAGSFCPVKGGDAYYSCKIDPDKYCKANGFSASGCLPYETESAEKCLYDRSGIYRKCNKSCLSRLVNEENMTVLVKDTLLYHKNTAVVLADVNDMPLTDPVKVNEFTTINGYTAYADKYSECRCQNMQSKSVGDPYFFNVNGSYEKYQSFTYCQNPVIVASRSNGVLNRNLSNLHIRIDHEQASSLNYLDINRAVAWKDLYIDNQNWSYKSPTTGRVTSYGTYNCNQLFYRDDGTVIRVNNRLDMSGKIYIESPDALSRVMLNCSNTQANKLALITIDVPGNLNIVGNGTVRGTDVYLKDVNIYEGVNSNPNAPSHIQLTGKAYLWVSGSGIHIDNGDFGIEDGSFVSTTYLGALNNGGAKAHRWIMVVKNSYLYADYEVQIQDGGLMVKGGSEFYVRSGDGVLARNSVVCVHGSYLATSYQGRTLWAGIKSPYGGCGSQNCCNESFGSKHKVSSYAPYYYNSIVTGNSNICSRKASDLP